MRAGLSVTATVRRIGAHARFAAENVTVGGLPKPLGGDENERFYSMLAASSRFSGSEITCVSEGTSVDYLPPYSITKPASCDTVGQGDDFTPVFSFRYRTRDADPKPRQRQFRELISGVAHGVLVSSRPHEPASYKCL